MAENRRSKGELSESARGPLTEIERALTLALDEREFPGDLGPALRHALLGGGKRIRPLLCWHSCIAAGGRGPEALAACTAVEMVHAFSLVHDDLPALDDDELRRGRPTVHVAFGEATAILAGDALLSLAHEVLHGSGLEDAEIVACAGALARATREMIGGQVLDLGECPTDLEGVRRIHVAKTAALIGAACEMGAICAGGKAGEGATDTLASFGLSLGLLFQATDDLIDVEQASEHAGKATGKDERMGKATLPRVLGIEGARGEVERLRQECEEIVEPLGPRAGVLREIAAAIARRTR